LLIVKNGKLIFEAFTQGSQLRDRYQHVQSVTKSVTSIVFGMAFADGYIDSLDQLLYTILPDEFPDDPAKRQISLRHLLTMRSGIQFDNDVFSVEIHADRPDDPIRYILEKGMYNAPGAEFYYRDCDPHLISAVLQRALGRSMKSYAAEKLFGPLGITDYYWIADPAGITSAAHGLHIRPRDMAKLGQMMLDNGRWQGVQVVDSAWVAASTSQQTTIGPQEGTNFSYGYYRKLLEAIKSNFDLYMLSEAPRILETKGRPKLILRHDVDVSLKKSLDMARIEKIIGKNACPFPQAHKPFEFFQAFPLVNFQKQFYLQNLNIKMLQIRYTFIEEKR